MKMGMSRLLIALAAVAAGGAIFAAARRYTPAQENAGRETVELNLLMSLGGDGMREEYMRQRLDAYGELNPDVRVSATFVESDTLVFLKLLYAGKGYHYDVVCMGDDSMLSAAEQKLIYPMDEFVMRDLGLAWLDAVPGACLENTMSGGKIYGLPFIKSRLKVYYRDEGGGAGELERMEPGRAAESGKTARRELAGPGKSPPRSAWRRCFKRPAGNASAFRSACCFGTCCCPRTAPAGTRFWGRPSATRWTARNGPSCCAP